MLKITCFKCHWSWSLNRQTVQAAVDSLEPGASHYTVECPKCRRINKVAVKRLKRALPRVVPEAPSPDQEQPT